MTLVEAFNNDKKINLLSAEFEHYSEINIELESFAYRIGSHAEFQKMVEKFGTKRKNSRSISLETSDMTYLVD